MADDDLHNRLWSDSEPDGAGVLGCGILGLLIVIVLVMIFAI